MKAPLRGLKIRQKLLLSSLVYALPIAVLLYFVVSGINDNIRFARLETQGNKVLTPLVELLGLLSQHRVESWFYLSGDGTVHKDMGPTSEKIDKAFGVLLAKARDHEKPLRIDAPGLKMLGMEDMEPARIKGRWEALKANVGQMMPEMSDTEHAQIIGNIRRLITRIGDTSNLILDPDVDSSYMIDLVLLAIPQTLERLGEITLLGEQILTREQATDQEMAKFALLTSMLEKVDIERIQQDIATALREDGRFFGTSPSLQDHMPAALRKCRDSLTRLLLALGRVSRFGEGATEREEFAKAGAAACENICLIGRAAFGEIAILLEMRHQVHRNKMFSALFVSAVALAMAGAFVFFISHGITRPLSHVMEVARKISMGDIEQARKHAESLTGAASPVAVEGPTAPRRAGDEIWQLATTISNMTRSLYSLILQVHKSGIQVVTSSTEILASSRELEAAAAQQASSTNEVRATSNAISLSSQELVKTVRVVMETASETAGLTVEGLQRLAGMETTMGQLTEATTTIASSLEAIRQKTTDIGTIVSTITRVADQTNLLSLNAAIEAEKAGQYGLGFSVVAREIRRLADQTAVATLDIEQMVEEMESTVSSGVMEIDKFVRQVRQGLQEVVTISGQLTAIMDHIQSLIPKFEGVNGSMQVQSTSADEISQAMGQLSDGAEQTREVVRDFNAVTEQLNEAVHALQNEVSFFKVEA